jgi:hypothetical protein
MRSDVLALALQPAHGVFSLDLFTLFLFMCRHPIALGSSFDSAVQEY